MKKNTIKIMLFFISFVIPLFASAEEPPFVIGEPVIVGNGCPEGSYEVVLSRDSHVLSVYFKMFSAKTDDANTYDFANCNIAIPIEVPAGITVGLAGVDYRGIAYIPSGGRGVVSREHFFAGEQSKRITSYINTYDKFHDIFYPHEVGSVVWSKCGDDVIARSNATIFVSRPLDSEVNAQDYGAAIQFHIQWKECE
jgi:hypothetical protein